MPDIYKQQADWLKAWQEGQETMMKKYASWGEEWMANVQSSSGKEADLFKGWLPQGDMEGQLREFSQRMNEMVRNAWGDKIPAEMLKFMDISYFGEFYKNWISSLNLPEGMKTPAGMGEGWQQATDFLRSFLEKDNPYMSSFNSSKISDQLNWVFGTLLGTLGQEESAFGDIMKGYQDFFSKMFESSTAQSTEKMSEVFNTWSKEMEKHLSAPKLGVNKELAHDMSQILVLSQDYLQTYHKFARLVEATGRKAAICFQNKMSEAALKNKPVHKFVDLCALWSVENETVFTEVMGTPEFAKLQGDFVNAGHRLKIHLNKLGERALEETPVALKRDLDLAIAEITQLKRDMRAFRRELREREKETKVLREAQAVAEVEAKAAKETAIAAQAEAKAAKETAIAAQAEAKAAKAAKEAENAAAQVEAKPAKETENAAQVEAKAAKGAGASLEEPAKRVKSGKKTGKAASAATTKTQPKIV